MNTDAPFSLNDTNSIEESRRLIGHTISRHEAAIVALKVQQNGLAPISRLPPEILCRIFTMVKAQVQIYSFRKANSLKWIKVTHVSSHWRRVAVNFVNLWVDLPLKNLRWVGEMLQRSKDAGLVIQADVSPNSIRATTPGLKLALKHGSRIQHLSIWGIHDISAWNDLQKSLPKSAPRLEHFSISGGSFPQSFLGSDMDDPSSNPVVISNEVLRETKRIRRLSLSDCNPNWKSHPSLFHSLKSLVLVRPTLPTGKQFIDALKGMPDLECLEIRDAFPVEQTSWASDQLHLTSLRILTISSTYTDVKTFFRVVNFPPTARVKIQCSVGYASNSHVDPSGVILSLSRSYLNVLPETTLHALVRLPGLAIGSGCQLKLFLDGMAERLDMDDFYRATANLEILFGWEASALSEQHITKVFPSIFGSLFPRRDISVHLDLEYNSTDLTDATVLVNTFGVLPQVYSIIAGRRTSRILLNALQLKLHLEEEELFCAMENYYFPQLSSIHFRSTKFWELGVSECMQDPTSISVELLRDFLIRRLNSGAKLEKLTFKYCRNLVSNDIQSLSQVVGEIDWDEVESYSDSDSEYDE